MLCAERKQEAPIVVTVTNAVSSKDSLPGLRVLPNSTVEVAKVEDLVVFRDVRCSRVCADQNSRLEYCADRNTEECEMLFALQ